MAEAAAAAPEMTPTSPRLPVLHPDPSGELFQREAVMRLQHMFNDLDRWSGKEVVLNENGGYGPKTTDRVKKFQKDHGIDQTGSVGRTTWEKLLMEWLPVQAG